MRAFFAAGILISLFAGALSPAAAQTPWLQTPYQCRMTNIDNVDFGTIESSTVNPINISGSFEISCSGRPMPKTMGFCLGIGNDSDHSVTSSGFRELSYQGKPDKKADKLLFRFKGGGNTVIGGMWRRSPPPYAGQTNSLNGGSFNIGFTAMLAPNDISGFRVNDGLYLSRSTVSFYYGSTTNGIYPYAGNCSYLDWPHTEQTGTMTIKANAKSSCNITVAQHITFLKSFDLSKIAPQQGTITARCSEGTKYQIGLNTSSNNKNRRAMKRADGRELIYYNLYRDSGYASVWGNQWGIDTVKGVGNGASQPIPVWAKIDDNHPTPPAGVYRDTVIAEIRVD